MFSSYLLRLRCPKAEEIQVQGAAISEQSTKLLEHITYFRSELKSCVRLLAADYPQPTTNGISSPQGNILNQPGMSKSKNMLCQIPSCLTNEEAKRTVKHEPSYTFRRANNKNARNYKHIFTGSKTFGEENVPEHTSDFIKERNGDI
jgi:hypothetical protein